MAKPASVTPVTIRCTRCHGHGTLPLSEVGTVYAETYRVVAGLKGETTGAELGRLLEIDHTAASNRLAALEEHGLLVSRRSGRKRLYRVMPFHSTGPRGGE